MKKIGLFLRFLILFSLLAAPLQFARSETEGWQNLATGIDYTEMILDGPVHIYVARMDRSNPRVILESAIGRGGINRGLESVRGMASRYDQTVNYWGGAWGPRSEVVVAINGDLFDWETLLPRQGVVASSWYAWRYDGGENRSGLAFKSDRSVFIGRCVTYAPGKQVVTYADKETQNIDGLNVERGDNELILYTPQYDSNTGTGGGVEVLVEMGSPTMIGPATYQSNGIVRAIYGQSGSTPIPFDHVVLSASRSSKAGKILKSNVDVGDQIRIEQNLQNCKGSPDVDWRQTYTSIGGDATILKNGAVYEDDIPTNDVKNPRTAIAYNDQYIFFIVVDGRHDGVSVGMTMRQLAKFARDMLGATDAINEDGGGSSTMVINGQVVNRPSDAYATNAQQAAPTGAFTVYLPVLRSSIISAPTPAGPGVKGERAVANGIMMVVVEPVDRSMTFVAGEAVAALQEAEVRLGPGTNYAVLTTVPAGTLGLVLAHDQGLEGVLAKGEYWWKVRYEAAGIEGWVKETSLTH